MKRIFAVLALACFSLIAAPGLASASDETPVCKDADVSAWGGTNGDGVIGAHTVSGPEECVAYISTFLLPKTWDGNGWNPSAAPQTLYKTHLVTLTRTIKFFQAELPECGGVQVDLHPQAPPETLTFPAGVPGGVLGNGFELFVVNGQQCQETPPGEFQATSDIQTDCGTATVAVHLEQVKDGTIPDNLSVKFNVLIDGKTAWTATLTKPGSSDSKTFTFNEDSGVHTVTVMLDGEPNGSANVKTDCERNNTPPPPPPPTPPNHHNHPPQPSPPTPTPTPPPMLPATGGNGSTPALIGVGLLLAVVGAGIKWLSIL